jgi:hypothetical protein
MRRHRPLIAVGICAAFLLGTLAVLVLVDPVGARAVATAVPPTTIPRQGGVTPPASPPPATLDQPGSPAIRPATVSTDPALRSFSADDARSYIANHPHPDQAVGAAPATITSVEFLPAQTIDARLGGNTGMRPTTLLCLVTLHGSFDLAGPHGVSRSAETAYLIFDAHSGNIVVEAVGR